MATFCSRDGFVSDAGAAACSPCPTGTFREHGAANTCLPCPAGKHMLCLALRAFTLRPVFRPVCRVVCRACDLASTCIESLHCRCRPQAVGPTLLPQLHHARCAQQVSVCCATAPSNLRAAALGSHHSDLPAVLPAPCAVPLPSQLSCLHSCAFAGSFSYVPRRDGNYTACTPCRGALAALAFQPQRFLNAGYNSGCQHAGC
jgi:hypothetical protein